MTSYRPTWVTIDLDAIDFNLSQAQKAVPHKKVIPVIKANAYGHGAVEIFKHLIKRDINFFAVSLLEEALELRRENQEVDILMLGAILEDQLEVAERHNIQVTIYDKDIYKTIIYSDLKLKCHLKVDTGMSRYGIVEPNDVIEIVNRIQEKPNLELVGIYTHFSTANEDEHYYHMQLEKIKKILNQIKILPKMVHISNSSSTFKYEDKYDFTTHVRLGISLYGLSLDNPKPNIKPVMSLHSKIVQIKHLKAFDHVGYGATYEAKKDEIIGILPIGYADGWIRKNKTGSVEINGKLYKIVGIICMDACFIKIDEYVCVGDEAILFGNLIHIDDIAKRLNTINYEVACQISNRVPRIYKGGNI